MAAMLFDPFRADLGSSYRLNQVGSLCSRPLFQGPFIPIWACGGLCGGDIELRASGAQEANHDASSSVEVCEKCLRAQLA